MFEPERGTWLAVAAVMLLVACAGAGCGCQRKDRAGNLTPLDDPEKIKELEQEVAIPLPADVAVVTTHIDPVRPAHYWIWLLYSRSGFDLDPEKLPSIARHDDRDVDTDRLISMIQKLVL